MRRLLPILTVLLACLLGLPATASAAPTPLGGGDVLFNPFGAGGHCTAAFAATDGGAGYLVAGPGCSATVSTQLYSGANVLVGPVVAASAGYVVVQVTNTAAWEVVGWIDVGGIPFPVGGSAETPLGGQVCLLGATAGVRCGTVLAKNETILFPWGTVSGLTRTNVCASPGDVVYVTGDQVQGVPVGGSGFCTTSGASWFHPANPILAAYGLTLLTG